MYYTIIRFPFQSVNDEQYYLTLALNSSTDMGDLTDYLDKNEKQFFIHGIDSTGGGDTIYNFEGTLTGSVRAVDDEREDMFVPLVCSKLSFNMAVENFPTWLMDYCEDRRVKVILHKVDDKDNLYEMWRGYLIDQTLNLTVVYDKLSVPLVAVDEVSMAKYMKFANTIETVTSQHWCTVFQLMRYYHELHHTDGINAATNGFAAVYSIIGLNTANSMLWQRDLCINDDDGDPISNIPQTLVVNLDRWWLDKDATWETVLEEVLDYLGVTFAVGSFGSIDVNDAYLLTCPFDSATVEQYIYSFTAQTATLVSADQFTTLTNPTKYGANLQVTAEPDKYMKVKVTSEPKRWESHEYLTDEHYKPVSATKSVRFEWGEKNGGGDRFKFLRWHKLKYTKPDANEADFVEIPPCADGEGYLMARSGELPCVDLDSCTGLTEPTDAVADTLDFITFKEGCCCIKLGQGDLDGIDEDKMLSNYFLIMNHNWDNMFKADPHTMETLHLGDTPWLKLKPFGYNLAVHPSDKHYLSLKFDLKFIRENMPSVISGAKETYLFLKAVDANTPCVLVFWDTTPAIIMPSETSEHDFAEAGDYNASLAMWWGLYFQAYVRIGNFYYDGTDWQYISTGQTPPKCDMTLWSDTNEIEWVTYIGQRVITTKSYYYTIANPYRSSSLVDRYSNQTRLISSLDGVSIHGQPLEGQLEIQILGQIRLQNSGVDNRYNSIPFALINNIDAKFTDDAEFVEKDITNKEEGVIDATSTTKETLEKQFEMATPSVDGFFNNCLLFDGGKAWHNVRSVRYQSYIWPVTFEKMRAIALANQYSAGQVFVELETPVAYDDNVHNVGFRVTGLTEVDGRFLPVKRDFDYTRETMRVKLMRVNALPSD